MLDKRRLSTNVRPGRFIAAWPAHLPSKGNAADDQGSEFSSSSALANEIPPFIPPRIADSQVMGLFTCPCCGFTGLEMPSYANAKRPPFPKDISPPYSKFLGEPSCDVCPCCGFEFGYDDEPGAGPSADFASFRAEWISNGSPWFEPDRRPDGWDLVRQLERTGLP